MFEGFNDGNLEGLVTGVTDGINAGFGWCGAGWLGTGLVEINMK